MIALPLLDFFTWKGLTILKPIIGIACGQKWQGNRQTLYVHKPYSDAIAKAGGVPVLLPIVEGEDLPLIDIVDGLLLPGGVDVDPRFYNEEPAQRLGTVDLDWDYNDVSLCKKALYVDMPILGICRGHQVLNVALGGILHQDIPTEVQDALKHDQGDNYYNPCHTINVKRDTLLFVVFQTERLEVNSSHHQAVKEPGKSLIVSAFASDHVVEAIESAEHRFVLGLQWHPELMCEKFPEMLNPFLAFCRAAQAFRREKHASKT